MHTFLSFSYVIHMVAVLLTALYGLHRLVLLRRWVKLRRRKPEVLPRLSEHPMVTVQLPLYNEEAVAARLLESVGRLAWPKDRLEIQILDDSTDGTQAAVDLGTLSLQEQGFCVDVLRRSSRKGFKAGALAEGLERCKGEFIAIFDADFIPPASFLEEMVPRFQKPEVGMVQGRWGFLNASDSVTTGVQALALSSHFDIEHATRHARGCFFNFNGTAGVWRKTAIVEAGGWSADTLTEDLDLSYRAQLAGWKLDYHGACVAPSELPPTLTDFVAQQERWNKGSMQTAVKILPRLLRANLPGKVKVEALFHLLAGLGWLAGALATITLWPALVILGEGGSVLAWLPGVAVLTGSCGALIFYYLVYASLEPRCRGLKRYILFLPLVCIGVAPFLARSILSGLVSRKGVFHRTPKYGGKTKKTVIKSERPLKMAWVAFFLFWVTLLPLTATETLSAFALPLASSIPMGYLFTAALLAREGGAPHRMRAIFSSLFIPS